MKATNFRIDPGVPSAFQDTPFFGFRAIEFQRTRIAGAGWCAVGCDLPLMIRIELHKLVSGGALPIVEVTKVNETGIAVTLSPFL